MSPVTGFRVKRLERGMSIQQLAELSNLSPYIIRRCEQGDLEQISLLRVLTLADTLNLSLAEGCNLHITLPARQRPYRHEPRNVLENYMAHWSLTLQGLAMILGVSAQTASVQCAKKSPDMKYVQCLALEEGLSVPDFLEFYRALGPV